MAKQSGVQKNTVGRVMHEFKHGELESGTGKRVKNPRQAIAIALSEAGASNRETPEQNKRDFIRTRQKEQAGQTSRQLKEGRSDRQGESKTSRVDLYQEAKQRGVKGRSRMTKQELERALGR